MATDTLLADRDGEFTLGRAETTPDDNSRGFVDSSQSALDDCEPGVEDGFPDLLSTVSSGTAMLGRLVKRESAVAVGILTTAGTGDTLRTGRGRQSHIGFSHSDRLHLNSQDGRP